MFKRALFLVLLHILTFPVLDTQARENSGVVGNLGFGFSGTFDIPVGGMNKRFRTADTWGILVSYIKGPHTTVELEYHRNRYDPGKLEQGTFLWPQDKPNSWLPYKSPLARNYMTIDAFTVEGLYHFMNLASEEGTTQGLIAGPYFTYGGGFYRYSNEVSGLIFAGQPDVGTGLDSTLLLAPFTDSDVGWGLHVGLGVEAFMGKKASIDVRGRCHMIIGELRQMNAYNVARAYPLFYADFGVTMKFYIVKL